MGDGAMGYDDNNDDGGGTMGKEADDYGEVDGATGNKVDNDDNDGDGTERRNNQIEATAAAGVNNSHRHSTADSKDNEDDDNCSRQDCAMGMWAVVAVNAAEVAVDAAESASSSSLSLLSGSGATIEETNKWDGGGRGEKRRRHDDELEAWAAELAWRPAVAAAVAAV